MTRLPFQLGTVVESLQGAGLLTDDSIRLARGSGKALPEQKRGQARLTCCHLDRPCKKKRTGAGAGGPVFAETTAALLRPLRVPRRRPPKRPPFSRPQSRRDARENRATHLRKANTLARQIEGELRRTGSGAYHPARAGAPDGARNWWRRYGA